MNHPSYREVRAVFDAALEQPIERRALFLERRCNGDHAVRNEVEALLAAHARTDTPLDRHAFNQDWQSTERLSPQAGRRLGAYRLIGELGRGGMATVYLAERADELYRKNVAIKLLDQGWSWTETELRFQQERQILARLDHPNIARLLDAGTSDEGLSYLVMEYVEGRPVHHYCNEHALGFSERLRLFLRVCDAVSAAHRNLVIHRDLKPSNILVTRDGQPKLLDFGIAKLLETGEWHTSTGLQRMTPQYASPEQVKGDSVTTASDVYSLGVLLYQLLTDRLPYPADRLTPLQMGRAVVEDEPLRPRTLDPRLARDLESILLKTLRKEPEHRYLSVDAFREEIERYLEGLPVKARRDTYRAGKFLRRHTAAVVSGALLTVVLAITAGIAVRTAHTARLEAARNERLLYTARISAAAEAWEVGDASRAVERLELSKPAPGRADLRNFEWFLLWNLTHPPSFPLSRISGALRGPLAFSPHNRLIASATEDNSVEVFGAGGRRLRALQEHTDKVDAIDFSPDGALVATGARDRKVILWEVASGRVMRKLEPQSSWIRAVRFAPIGRRLVSVELLGNIKLWDLEFGKVLTHFEPAGGRCEVVDFSPDGRLLAGGAATGRVVLWDTARGKQVATLSGGGTSIRSLKFSPDGRQLAAASASGTIQIWDISQRMLLFSLNRHSGSVESLAYSPDGARFASLAGRQVLLWNSTTGQVLAEFMGSGTLQGSLAFSPSGKTLVANGWGHTVREWDVDQASALQTLSGLRDRTERASFSPDGRTLLTASRGGGVSLWEAATGRRAAHVPVRGRFAEVSPSGKQLAIGITDGVVLIYSYPPGKEPIRQLNTNFHRVISVSFSPDGRLLAIRGDHPIAQVWDLESNQLVANLLHDQRVTSVIFSPSPQEFDVVVTSLSFSPDGQTLATGSQDGSLWLWTQAGKRASKLQAHQGSVNAIRFASPTRIVTGGEDGLIKSWDLLSGTAVLTFKRQLPYVSHLAISPDGKRLASTGDHDLKIWELETGTDLLSLHPDIRQVQSLMFSPDGLCLVAAGIDGDIRIWRATHDVPAERWFAGP